jgi:hypothetical protein
MVFSEKYRCSIMGRICTDCQLLYILSLNIYSAVKSIVTLEQGIRFTSIAYLGSFRCSSFVERQVI